ncbi:M48 family metallopeptidase [Flavivirga eckloniae]|uniref:Peptidase M48 domain-containing protein n=1 Tax=Flavivirga eckloniae TaxID=1803846 RepID=A0A2K9PKL2_9FLAO|nr:M48 family metallopeptidase [Flavivirga eckloniae]AUP77603.1 hypothetical protein C1H87_02265 [Flavivirga eckloniae]
MNSFYTPISAKVPANYTKPTTSFTKHVWLSVFGLLLFIVLYLGLTIWFGRLAYNLFLDASNFDGHFSNYFLAVGFGFLSIFMAKSLFFLNKREENPIIKYINEKEEPVLFDYLHKLADEAGAPRPHKVFLTDRVNASVSYDISLINLLIPSKKNLEIGLGLVNVLSLGEFKAVLAHEFGHFAQRSMLLGRYVYVAQQIASRIVGKRDGFDTFLAGLSRVDLRIAWIGWILSILVWAIRSLIETCFRIVVVAERALSREMEFQADLVAVSLTGSDALIHALYKLQIADEAYDNAINCLNEELADKKAVKDMYTLQSNYIQQMAKTLDEPNYGKSPELPKEALENHRIFTSKKYNPPKMWSTHPADVDRENNAKQVYIYEPVDGKSSWDLFSDAQSYREDMTERLIKTAKVETTVINNEEALKNQNNEYFNWTFLDSKYHSAFFNRYAFLHFKSPETLFESNISDASLEESFKKIYPKNISEKIKYTRELEEEIAALIISENESLTLEKRRVWHRGNQIKRKDIPNILIGLKKELKTLQTELGDHDALCRTLHYKSAEKIDKNWGVYLKKLTGLVHYSEHSISNINDVARKFNNVLNIALADGNVSSSELVDIINVSNEYYNVLRRIYKHSETINLDSKLLENMKVENYQSLFEEFKLPSPTKENINDWINVVSGWASLALRGLEKLRNESLELLLDTEEDIKEAYLDNKSLNSIPTITGVPEDYQTLVPGSERNIQRKLGAWDRFATGDGFVPSAAKFGIAGSILFAAIFWGSQSQKLPFYIYNGLQTHVNVNIDSRTISLEPNEKEEIQLNYGTTYDITTTSNGLIVENESFEFTEHDTYIYNIANAAVFIQNPIFYGYKITPNGINDSEILGAKKLFSVKADYILEEPPETISMPTGSIGERREAISAYSNVAPENLTSVIESSEDLEKIIKSHSMWDDRNSKNVLSWIYYLKNVEAGTKVIESRLSRNPNEAISLRAMQDLSDSLTHKSVCEKHIQLSQDNPDNATFYYLATRCIEDEDLKNQRFVSGHKKWKDHDWLAYASAYVYIERGDLRSAYDAFKVVSQNNESLAELIAIEAERVKRILNIKENGRYETIVNNPDIDFYNGIENGEIEGKETNSDYVYYLIQKGNLEEAYKLSQNFESIKDYAHCLIASSKGATKQMKDAIFNDKELSGLNLGSVWSVLGLAIKENRNYKMYLDTFDLLELEDGFIVKLINLIKTKNYTEVDNHIKSLSLRWKAHTYVMASIILDGNIPLKWKQVYKAGLFANEKPFLN